MPNDRPLAAQPIDGPRAASPSTSGDVRAALQIRRHQAFMSPGVALPDSLPNTDDTIEGLIERAALIYASAMTDETRRSYVSRWNQFSVWAEAQGLEALPCTPATVILYLTALVDGEERVSLSTLRGRLAAINRVHLEAGEDPPGADPGLKVFVRSLGRRIGHGARREPVRALRIHDLRTIVQAIPLTDARMIRDRAILALSLAGVSDEGIAKLRASDVRVSRSSATVTDFGAQPDRGAPARVILRDLEGLPLVEAFTAWRTRAADGPDLLFTTTDSAGRRSAQPVSAADIRRTIESRTRALSPRDEPVDPVLTLAALGAPDAIAVRDRAVLLIGFAAAFRRVDLIRLCWGDVRDDPEGLIIHLRYSKTDRAGKGRDIGIPFGKSTFTCPVAAMTEWRDFVQTRYGDHSIADLPCFVTVGRSGQLGDRPMRPVSIRRIVVDRARIAGINGHWGGRSLRAGFISTAADLDIPLEEIARQSGHATLDSLIRYIRRDNPFHRNAVDRVGL